MTDFTSLNVSILRLEPFTAYKVAYAAADIITSDHLFCGRAV